ncbi:uncharacterized protein LOC131929742 [Physella acuta]|uniref:uncharacterized protein LOC131929742 n=1 Tax=Physella acuta TaxID=109671 RepID=UPI0027DDB494|nr:uncharacterized protein LOC131929742 [Physella acuta]
MTISTVLCFLALLAGIAVEGASHRASLNVKGHHMGEFPQQLFARGARSALDFWQDCVSIPHLTQMKERFVRWLDHNNDGVSTFDEVKNFIRRFKPDVRDETVAAYIRRRDTNGNGVIDFVPEYVHEMTASESTLDSAKEEFQFLDSNDDGLVTEKEIVRMSEALDQSPEEALQTAQLRYMPADVDKDGKLSFDEFKAVYNL